jgi:hypothetical protein
MLRSLLLRCGKGRAGSSTHLLSTPPAAVAAGVHSSAPLWVELYNKNRVKQYDTVGPGATGGGVPLQRKPPADLGEAGGTSVVEYFLTKRRSRLKKAVVDPVAAARETIRAPLVEADEILLYCARKPVSSPVWSVTPPLPASFTSHPLLLPLRGGYVCPYLRRVFLLFTE